MTDLSLSLSSYTPISLEEMDHVKLLDRIDTKFVIHEQQLQGFLAEMSAHYNVLMIGGQSLHPYETLYFDTPEYQLYMMHHNGKRHRFKLRCRKYVNSGISFFEVKTKTNSCRTVKKRLQIDCIPESLNEQLKEYITANTFGDYQDFMPVLRVFFERLTLVNKHANERLTVDLNLRYKNNGSEREIENMVIVEVKQEKYSISPFRELMKQHKQHKNYLSKYCLGITCLNSELKKNRFKQKINALNKLGYDIS